MKKIMFYTMTMSKGGTETNIASLVNYFIKYYAITLVTNISGVNEYQLDKRIKWICLDSENKTHEKNIKKLFTKLSLKRTLKFKKIIQEEKPDLIITFLPEPTMRALSLKKKINIPIIVSTRNHPKKEYPGLKFIRNYYFKKADIITIQDSQYQKYFPKKISHKLVTIPNYISKDFINYQNRYHPSKKIVTVTRLNKQKNLPLLIKAFKLLSFEFNDYKLYIYGEGKERINLKKLINKLDLENKVFLMGTKSKIIEEIKNASLFVLPSNYEGMPNCLLESMALGLPVITTNSTEAIHSIIKNGQNGLIINKNDLKALKEAMGYLLKNKEIAKEMSKKALMVKNIYREEIIIKLWENIFKEIGKK